MKIKRTGVHYAYIVKCADGTYYTGYTPDLARRIHLHNTGKGAKYTRGRGPVILVWCQEYRSRSRALSEEAMVKKMTRVGKERLIKNGE